ncbi:MAG: hypothetical protein KF745_07010 [Phycisphaeraceae bacterium]|nr:hypothetical protein [Phycisphaeraceae bacterium]
MPSHPLITAMSTTLDALQDLPWAAHAAVGMALAAGVVLWLFGRRVLRPMTIVLMAAVGGIAGCLIIPFTPFGDEVGLVGGAIAGLAVGGLAGMLLHRFATALGFALVLGCAAPIATAVLLPLAGEPDRPSAPLALGDHYLRGATAYNQLATELRDSASVGNSYSFGDEQPGTRRDAMRESVSDAGRKVGAFVGAIKDEAAGRWEEVPQHRRFYVILAAAGGSALGFLMGLAMPMWAGGAVTAMIGAGVMLSSGVWLMTAGAVPGTEQISGFKGATWLMIWGVTAAIGMGVQWSGLGKTVPGDDAPQ